LEREDHIAFADVIVLNETDLVSELDTERPAKRVRRMNGAARVIRAVRTSPLSPRGLPRSGGGAIGRLGGASLLDPPHGGSPVEPRYKKLRAQILSARTCSAVALN